MLADTRSIGYIYIYIPHHLQPADGPVDRSIDRCMRSIRACMQINDQIYRSGRGRLSSAHSGIQQTVLPFIVYTHASTYVYVHSLQLPPLHVRCDDHTHDTWVWIRPGHAKAHA
jgi:hypothetical protein